MTKTVRCVNCETDVPKPFDPMPRNAGIWTCPRGHPILWTGRHGGLEATDEMMEAVHLDVWAGLKRKTRNRLMLDGLRSVSIKWSKKSAREYLGETTTTTYRLVKTKKLWGLAARPREAADAPDRAIGAYRTVPEAKKAAEEWTGAEGVPITTETAEP